MNNTTAWTKQLLNFEKNAGIIPLQLNNPQIRSGRTIGLSLLIYETVYWL